LSSILGKTSAKFQWLNYSKVGGGTLHFFPSFFFLNPLPSFSLPPPLEVGRPFQWFWASAVIFPCSGVWGRTPAEIVFGAFKP